MKAMKVLAALFVAASMFAVAGCSKDDSISKNDLVGSWNMTKQYVSQTVSGLTGEYASYNGTREHETEFEEGRSTVFIFGSDGSFSIVNTTPEGSRTRTGTWSLSGTTVTMNVPYTEGGEPETQQMNVDEVSGSKLVLSTRMTETTEVGGQVATLENVVKIYFDKM
jgi:hypothetical protein